ncbi:MAG: ROK family protein [Oscillospiraceae bacterium]|nr:ROK family protein [Oscillospiraceae bacterium]
MIKPILDHDFVPAVYFNRDFLAKATKPFSIAVEREDGLVYRRDTKLGDDFAENCRYAERLIKTILWCAGGWKVMLSGDHAVYEYIRDAYTKEGLRAFDVDFWSTTYERPFEVVELAQEDMPENKARPLAIGRNLGGCRVGFDAGGSDMKVAAVVDGETVWSEEIVWLPKLQEDISYHHEHIKAAILKAAEHMPRFDAVGVSTAGVLVANRAMVSHLFIKVPKDTQGEACKNVYVDVLNELGVPYAVANDGDVAALAASMAMNVNGVLGIAMGTSEAGGYIDQQGHVTGWHNELAFVPVDYNPDSPVDEWSGDYGCGVKYFSQDAVIRLAPKAGIKLDESLTLAEKLKAVQKVLEDGHEGAKDIFRTIGTYFGYAIANYADFYDISYLQISGRVTSGLGGDLIIAGAKEVLHAEFPELAAKIEFILPDEMDRRVGQAVAAASLPAVG